MRFLVKLIRKTEDEGDEESVADAQVNVDVPDDEKKGSDSTATSVEQHDVYSDAPIDKSLLPADAKRAFWLSTIIIIIIAVLVPIPLGASSYIFSPRFFTGWIVVSMVSHICNCCSAPTYLIGNIPDLVLLRGLLLYNPTHLGEPRCSQADRSRLVQSRARSSRSESLGRWLIRERKCTLEGDSFVRCTIEHSIRLQ